MKIRPFGLDISTVSMKAVWLSEEKSKFSLSSIVQSQMPSKGILSESPFDQEAMAQSIKQILTQGKITTPYVNIALPDSQVYTRVIEMPYLTDAELNSAIYWEAEQYIPLPLNSVTLDWVVLEKPDNPIMGSSKMQVLLVGSPTVLLNKYQKILAMAGLTINVVETEILSTIRPFVQENAPNRIIVNIGDVSTSFAIIKNGVIVFSYSVSTGGIAITRAIASDFGLDISTAEEYKKTFSILQGGTGGKIGKATAPILMSIITEIKKALAFYAEKYQGEMSIKQIVISGANARLYEIDLFFAQNCGIETITANPFDELGIDTSGLPKEIIERASDFTVAVGLGMLNYE